MYYLLTKANLHVHPYHNIRAYYFSRAHITPLRPARMTYWNMNKTFSNRFMYIRNLLLSFLFTFRILTIKSKYSKNKINELSNSMYNSLYNSLNVNITPPVFYWHHVTFIYFYTCNWWLPVCAHDIARQYVGNVSLPGDRLPLCTSAARGKAGGMQLLATERQPQLRSSTAVGRQCLATRRQASPT